MEIEPKFVSSRVNSPLTKVGRRCITLSFYFDRDYFNIFELLRTIPSLHALNLNDSIFLLSFAPLLNLYELVRVLNCIYTRESTPHCGFQCCMNNPVPASRTFSIQISDKKVITQRPIFRDNYGSRYNL
jgi:hypothetical protein